MTEKQLEEIKEFAKTFYDKTDQFHDMRHAELTVKYALKLAKDFPETNLKILEAACILHDIGMIKQDLGHQYESAKLSSEFLKKLNVDSDEEEKIVHAIYFHGDKDINQAKSIEAKILFDADKIQQLSVYGFLKQTFFRISFRKMDMVNAIEDMWKRVEKVWPIIQLPRTKEILDPEIKKIKEIVFDFKKGLNAELF